MARTYKRDALGRFAGGGGGGGRPKARSVARGANRLTRDNAGRITSVGGDGATARGGRLRTAAGNLRATQTTRLKGGTGRLRGKAAAPQAEARVNVQQGHRTAASKGLERGTFVRANLRPRNTMAKPQRRENPYQEGKANMKYRISKTNDDKKARMKNAQTAKSFFESRGLKVKLSSSRASSTVASVNPLTREVSINRSHTSWINPAKAAINSRRTGFTSSSSPMHTAYHELGHARDKNLSNRVGPLGNMWILATRKGSSQARRAERGDAMQRIARRVSRYATTNPSEFIAETYAGRRTGRRYDHEVMRAYREAMGLRPTSVRRTISSRRRRTS